MASALVHLGIDQIQHVEPPPMFITMSQYQRRHAANTNKKHLKNVGPICYCEPPLYCQSPGVASRTPAIAITQAACDVHNDDDNDNA